MGLILRTTHDNLPAGATVSNSRLSVQQMDNNFIYLQSIASGNTDLTNLSTDIIPAANSVYSLGTSASQWKSLHVSGQTIYIGGVPLSTNNGSLVVNSINLGTTASPLILSADTNNNNTLIINGTPSIGATGPKGPTGNPGPNGLSSLSLVTLTVASASQYMESGWITTGNPYLITDADPNLYGTSSQFGFGEGTNILLYGVDENNFTSSGYGKFYNPNYASYSVWDSTATYSVSDKVIYGGKVWNLTATASVGSDNYWNLQSDWEVIDYQNTTYYDVVWNDIEYSIADDYISSRYEVLYNNKVSDSFDTRYFGCETHPISAFRWGNNSGLLNCTVENSYFGCLNFVNGSISDVKLENGSMIWNINLLNAAYIETVKLSNYSELSYFTIDGGYLSNITIDNGSNLNYFILGSSYCYLKNITINNNSSIGEVILTEENNNSSYFENITLDNDSQIYAISLYSNNMYNSYFEDITISNDSYINYFTATASYLQNVNISNDSQIGGVYMENSNIVQLELTNSAYFIGDISTDDGFSGDGDIIITDSNLEFIKLTNNSLFTGPIAIINNSNIKNLYMENSYIGGREQDNNDLFTITIEDSILDNLVLEAKSYIANIEIHSSTLKNTKLSNYSKITSDGQSVYISYSTLDLISLSNHSYIGYDRIEIINGTNWYDVKLDNYSKIGGYVYFNNSQFGVISLNNNSKFWGNSENIIIGTSSVHYISLDNHSEINGYLEINSSTFQNIKLDQSFLGGYNNNFCITNGSIVKYITLSNGSWFEADSNNIYIGHNSTVEYINLTNDSYIDGHLEVGRYGTSSCYLGYLDLTNESYLGLGIYITEGGSLSRVKLENNSRLGGYDNDDIVIYQNSIMQNIEITNDSYISGYMELGEGSFFQNIKIDNNSYLSGNIYIYGWNTPGYGQGSTFENVTVTNGSNIKGNLYIGSDANQNTYGYIGNVTVTNGSVFGNNAIWVLNQARLEYITINNYSRFNKVYLSDNNTKMYYIDLNNYSYIAPNNLELHSGSEIKYLTLDNHSHIVGSTYLSNTSKIKRVQMANYSKIDGFNNTLSNSSEIQYVSMINVSDNAGTSCYGPGFTNFYLTGTSSIHGLDIRWSTFGGLYLSDSKIEGLEIDNNSKIYNVDMRSSSLLNSKFINSYLDGDYINPGQYGSILMSESFMENIVIDTVDFPTWNSDHAGISLHNNSVIRNMTLKNMCYEDRVYYFENVVNNSSLSNDRQGFAQDIYLDNGSLLENITITNSGEDWTDVDLWFRNVNLNASTITSVEGNLSAIDTITLNNSSIVGLKLASAGIYELYMGEGSSIYDLEINDTFNFYTNSLTFGANISRLVINNSWFYENSFNNASIYNATLNLSDFDHCILTNTGLENFTLDGSVITELNQSNLIPYINFELKNQEFGFGNDNSNIYSLTSVVGQNNTIKYQFSITLNGLSDGYVTMPRYVAPSAGWYIEKAIIDSTILVVSGTTSFSLGLQQSHPESVMDNVDSTVLSNKVKVFDLANGTITGGKSTDKDWIGLYVHDGTVTSGTMNIEITLKNTNYFTNWWA